MTDIPYLGTFFFLTVPQCGPGPYIVPVGGRTQMNSPVRIGHQKLCVTTVSYSIQEDAG